MLEIEKELMFTLIAMTPKELTGDELKSVIRSREFNNIDDDDMEAINSILDMRIILLVLEECLK